METTKYNNPLHNRQGKDKQFVTNLEFSETVIITENKQFERIVIVANQIMIKDENGNLRQTEQGTQYKVNIQDGQISFNEPLKFKNNG